MTASEAVVVGFEGFEVNSSDVVVNSTDNWCVGDVSFNLSIWFRSLVSVAFDFTVSDVADPVVDVRKLEESLFPSSFVLSVFGEDLSVVVVIIAENVGVGVVIIIVVVVVVVIVVVVVVIVVDDVAVSVVVFVVAVVVLMDVVVLNTVLDVIDGFGVVKPLVLVASGVVIVTFVTAGLGVVYSRSSSM